MGAHWRHLVNTIESSCAAVMRRHYFLRRPLYFHPVVSFFSFFFSSPNLSGHRLDVYHTSTRLSANLECRSEMCCTRLARNAGHKKLPKIRHLGTITQLCRAISSQLRHVSTIGAHFAEYWKCFMARFNYNSAGSERIWMKFGELQSILFGTGPDRFWARTDFGRDLCRGDLAEVFFVR